MVSCPIFTQLSASEFVWGGGRFACEKQPIVHWIGKTNWAWKFCIISANSSLLYSSSLHSSLVAQYSELYFCAISRCSRLFSGKTLSGVGLGGGEGQREGMLVSLPLPLRSFSSPQSYSRTSFTWTGCSSEQYLWPGTLCWRRIPGKLSVPPQSKVAQEASGGYQASPALPVTISNGTTSNKNPCLFQNLVDVGRSPRWVLCILR